MPAKQSDNWQDYFNRQNKTLGNFEQRLERLEKQVAVISKKPLAVSKEQEIDYASPPKRRLGWGLMWLGVLLYILPWFGLGFLNYIVPYVFRGLLTLALLIGGVILILTNPKQASLAAKKQKREADLGQESISMPEKEAPERKRALRVEASKKISRGKSTLEADIGKKWLPKIGIISIVLGVAFFVIYAIQNKWIGPTGQVALGVLAGIALIIAGEIFYRKDYRNYGMTIVGGGFAIMYFAMFAAYRFYGNVIHIPLIADIISLSIIIAGAVYFSMRYDSQIIAGEAFFLGYIVPLLTASVNTFFLIYAAALTAGLTVLAYFKGWKLLGAGGIVAIYATHLFWLESYAGANKSLLHLTFLFVYFLMFAVLAFKIKEERKEVKENIDSWVNSKNIVAAVLIITYIFLFQIDFHNAFFVVTPLILLLLAITFFVMRFRWNYFAVGGIILNYLIHWNWLQQNFNESFLLINFVTLSIYFVIFNILLFILYEDKNKTENVIGLLLNSFLYYSLNMWPMFSLNKGYQGLFTAGIAIFYLIAAYISYNKKISHYFNTCIVLCFGFLTLAIPLQFNREWITISWAVLTLILVLLSFRLKENIIRMSSSVVGGITLARVLFYDSWNLKAIDFANFASSTRLFAFALSIIIFYIIAYLYYRNKEKFADYKTRIAYVNALYAIAATILTTVIIWLEIWDTNMALNAKKLWTSLAFILQAIVILAFGFSAKIKLFRILGLLLFGLSIAKVFLYDLSNLETGYRIISFIVLGLIALLGSFLYNKYKEYI